MSRSCGKCSACCGFFEIPELRKPRGVACEHLQARGNYTVYFDDYAHGAPTNSVLSNNRFGRDFRYGLLVNDDDGAAIELNADDVTGECLPMNQ